ncbi:hypothetical protein [Kineococcus sp. NPDC059986]|uniref:winged helix-turn-helix transcriptional regulator n=1 Tax=Kineococcus sp. NPDC059986 TaxID=3155538 RepID=UPI00344BB6D5
MFTEVPVRVEYALTPLGVSAGEPLAHLRNWVEQNATRPRTLHGTSRGAHVPPPWGRSAGGSRRPEDVTDTGAAREWEPRGNPAEDRSAADVVSRIREQLAAMVAGDTAEVADLFDRRLHPHAHDGVRAAEGVEAAGHRVLQPHRVAPALPAGLRPPGGHLACVLLRGHHLLKRTPTRQVRRPASKITETRGSGGRPAGRLTGCRVLACGGRPPRRHRGDVPS